MSGEIVSVLAAILVPMVGFVAGHLWLANRWGGSMDATVKALAQKLEDAIDRTERRQDELSERLENAISKLDNRLKELSGDIKEIAKDANRVEVVERDSVALRDRMQTIERIQRELDGRLRTLEVNCK